MISVAILTERLKTGFGVDLVVHEQAKRLSQEHGFQVAVLAVEVEPEFKKNTTYSVLQVHLPLAFNPLKQDLIALKKFSKYEYMLKQFDVFIVQTPCFHAWIPFLRAQGKPVIAYYHGNSPSNQYRFPKNLRQPMFEWTQNTFYYPWVNNIATISNYMKKTLPEKFHKKTEVLVHGREHITDRAADLTEKDLLKFREHYFIKPDEKVITYVGRIDPVNNPYKNTRMLLALNQYLESHKLQNYRILALGVAENNADQEFMFHGITVIPKASNHDLACALKTSRVYVSPSQWEGFNLPLLEAQALGVPVVAFDKCAHPEVAKHNVSGFLVKDDQEFFESVLQLAKNDTLYKKMSRGALSHSEKFSWKTNVNKLAQMIKKIV